jgi:outer membrane protein W
MKKKLLIALSFVFFGISTHSSAQSENGFFLSLNGGYNFSSGAVTGFGTKSEQINKNTTTQENVKLSLGKGINFGLAAGYMFNRNVGTQIEVNYLLGGKTSFSFKDPSVNSTFGSDKYANMLQFKPSIIIAAGLENVNPYAKFGPLLGIGAIYEENNIMVNLSSVDINTGNTIETTNILTSKATYDGGLALGIQAAVGISIGLNTSLSLFGELNMTSLSYSPTKLKITESTLNGVDQLPKLTLSDSEYEFVDVLTVDATSPSNPNAPTKQIKTSYPFSSFGINFGLRYAL